MCCPCGGGTTLSTIASALTPFETCDTTSGITVSLNNAYKAEIYDSYRPEVTNLYRVVFDSTNSISDSNQVIDEFEITFREVCYNLNLYVDTPVEDFTYQVHSCTNDDAAGTVTDAQSNSCSWYDDKNHNMCGRFDSVTFTAASICCACGGGYLKDSSTPISTATVMVEKTPMFSNSDSDGACAVTKTWYGKSSETNDDSAWQLLSDTSPVNFPALGFYVKETCTNADVLGEQDDSGNGCTWYDT